MSFEAECAVEGCPNPKRGKGLCHKHYARLRRLGTTELPPSPKPLTLEERFWGQVDKTSTCWLWTGWKAFGYGSFRHAERGYFAHRLAYELVVGPIPEGLELDHLCRVRACVNPDHLEPVSHRENVRRVPKNQVTHCPKGHEHTPQNTTVPGRKKCRECNRERMRSLRARRREVPT